METPPRTWGKPYLLFKKTTVFTAQYVHRPASRAQSQGKSILAGAKARWLESIVTDPMGKIKLHQAMLNVKLWLVKALMQIIAAMINHQIAAPKSRMAITSTAPRYASGKTFWARASRATAAQPIGAR